MLVLLGEVGGVEEYLICEALKNGRINKPMVAWCIGTCSDMFTTGKKSLYFKISPLEGDPLDFSFF